MAAAKDLRWRDAAHVAGSNHNYRLGEDIMPDRKGGCLCRAVRYVLKGDHCMHCQKQS
jgi:hypothetical protein